MREPQIIDIERINRSDAITEEKSWDIAAAKLTLGLFLAIQSLHFHNCLFLVSDLIIQCSEYVLI